MNAEQKKQFEEWWKREGVYLCASIDPHCIGRCPEPEGPRLREGDES